MVQNSITNVTIGDIVVCFDEYSHDYVEHRLKINSIETDSEYATESNPSGIVLYGDDLSDDSDETQICFVNENNFVGIVK